MLGTDAPSNARAWMSLLNSKRQRQFDTSIFLQLDLASAQFVVTEYHKDPDSTALDDLQRTKCRCPLLVSSTCSCVSKGRQTYMNPYRNGFHGARSRTRAPKYMPCVSGVVFGLFFVMISTMPTNKTYGPQMRHDFPLSIRRIRRPLPPLATGLHGRLGKKLPKFKFI